MKGDCTLWLVDGWIVWKWEDTSEGMIGRMERDTNWVLPSAIEWGGREVLLISVIDRFFALLTAEWTDWVSYGIDEMERGACDERPEENHSIIWLVLPCHLPSFFPSSPFLSLPIFPPWIHNWPFIAFCSRDCWENSLGMKIGLYGAVTAEEADDPSIVNDWISWILSPNLYLQMIVSMEVEIEPCCSCLAVRSLSSWL